MSDADDGQMIYLVEQFYEWHEHEIIGCAFRTLSGAKAFCQRRANIFTWKEHDSHGRSWESLDGDGKYHVVEITLGEE